MRLLLRRVEQTCHGSSLRGRDLIPVQVDIRPEEHRQRVAEFLSDFSTIAKAPELRVLFLTRFSRETWQPLIDETNASHLIFSSAGPSSQSDPRQQFIEAAISVGIDAGVG